MHHDMPTQMTCSRLIRFDLDGDVVTNIQFEGGCNGNTTGISELVVGMNIDDVIGRVKGTKCGARPTSCPDQLAHALEEAYAAEQA